MYRFPDRIAVSVRHEHSVERFTYRQLDDRSCRAASLLAALGLGPGDRCALLAENSAGWVAVYLGVLRLGAVAVPFDTAYTPSQVAELVRDSGAGVLVTSRRSERAAHDAVEGACCRLALVDEAIGAEPGTIPPCAALPDDPAAILYTSGTTADPKGVVLTHANLLAEKDAAFQVVPVTEEDSILGVLPLFHALAQMANLLLPLSLGAHVVFLETLSTRELVRALDEERISIVVCVPQFFYLIHQRVTAEVASGGVGARAAFRGLLRLNRALRRAGVNAGPWLFRRVHRMLGRRMRILMTGGSKFDEAVGRDLHDLGFTILQAYGLTETSGAATVTRPGEPIHTVGTPLPGVEIRTLPAHDGRDGEVLVRGPVVMKGYWNRPDATAAVLRDGWLHTGDLGRLDDGGRLTITGRSKDVIVLSSGKNIYPEEIEAHYRQSPFIQELCVLGVAAPGEPAAERLHAFVVPDGEVLRERKIVNTSELIRFELEGLSVSLPSHKRVLGFDVTMEPLPRTTTGKLKRHEIRQRYGAGGAA
ncbi:MAG: AMP-dependent synthetase/ligase, partial [Vicinamibacterales bacterium]